MRLSLKSFLDFILPPRCLLCGKPVCSDNSLCVDCFEKITFITKPYCHCCGTPFYSEISAHLSCPNCLNNKPFYRYNRTAVVYDEYSKKLILDFKFHDHIENKRLFARWLYMAGKDIFDEGADLLIPIPLYKGRLFARKYNQSAILCRELSLLCGIKGEYTALIKAKKTIPQVLCSGKQRKTNVKGSFEVKHPEKIKDKRIVLIDDVYTTGATMKECAKILKKAGAKSIDVLTISRVVR